MPRPPVGMIGIGSPIDEDGPLLLRQLLQATVDHRLGQIPRRLVAAQLGRIVRTGFADRHSDLHFGILCLLVGVVEGLDARMLEGPEARDGARRGVRSQIRESRLDEGLQRLELGLAHHHQHHPLGAIPAVIKGVELRLRDTLDRALQTNRHAARERGVIVDKAVLGLANPPAHRVTVAHLRQNDAPLTLHLSGQQGQTAGIVAEQQEGLLDRCRVRIG